MTKRILLTRSKKDNALLKKILVLKGYDCIDCSLIEHINLPLDTGIIEKYTDIIITSKRAADIVQLAEGNKNAWVVGNVSAEILRKKNYNIKYIASSALELKEQLDEDIYANMIYLSSNIVSIKMPANIKTLQVYNVKYKNQLSPNEIKLIKNGLEYILLYSENCAKTLVKLIIANNLLKYLKNTVIITISPKVAMVVKDYFKNIIACDGADSMVGALLKET